MKKIPLRKSLVNAYIQCPYRCKRQFVDGVPMPRYPHLVEGTKFHQRAEDFGRELRVLSQKRDTMEEDVWWKAAENLFWSIFPDDDRSHSFWNQLMEYNEEHPYGFVPFLLEQKIRLENAPDWSVDSGTIDRVDKAAGDGYAIMEYKTGKYRGRTGIRRELCMYKFLIEQSGMLLGPVTHIGAFYPDAEVFFYEKISPQTVTATKKKVAQVRMDVQNQKFNKNITILCDWCPFIEECLRAEQIE